MAQVAAKRPHVSQRRRPDGGARLRQCRKVFENTRVCRQRVDAHRRADAKSAAGGPRERVSMCYAAQIDNVEWRDESVFDAGEKIGPAA